MNSSSYLSFYEVVIEKLEKEKKIRKNHMPLKDRSLPP